MLLCLFLTAGFSGGLTADDGDVLWSFSTFGEGGEDYFYRPSDIEIDHNLSLIHVVDSANHRIVTFDEKGRLVRIIGREGQGPGDLFRPTGAFVCEDSNLAVADYGNNRIQFFDKNGKFFRSFPCHAGMVADLFIFKKKIYTISTYGTSGFRIRPNDSTEFQPLLMVLDEKGEMVRQWTIRDFPEKQPFIRALKHRVCLAVSPDGLFFLPHVALNLVHVFDEEGSRQTSFKRDLPFDPVNPTLVSVRSSDDKSVVQMQARADMVTQAACFGPEGNLYLLTYGESQTALAEKFKDVETRPQPKMTIDVLNPDSHEPLRKLTCPSGTRAFGVLRKGRIVTIGEDDSGDIVLRCIDYSAEIIEFP